MPPELRSRARMQAFEELPGTVDPKLGIKAAAKGRFENHFCRDGAVSLAQSLLKEGNFEIDPNLIILPGIQTINTIANNQSPFDLLSRQMPGMNAHEVHTKDSPQGRLRELKNDGWPVNPDPDGNLTMKVYYAGDANGLTLLATERVLNAVAVKFSPETANQYLRSWWPFLERTILYDIFYNDRNGDRLVETNPNKDDKIQNQTWRDSSDAFIYGPGNGIIPTPPLTFFANNCFAIAGLASGAELAKQMGFPGFAESLRERREHSIEMLHDKF